MNLAGIQQRIRADAALLPGARSFLLRPQGRAKARILMLHGFSASPYELRELGTRLQRRGCLVYAPRLAGHGEGRQAFDRADSVQWLAQAEADFALFNQPGKKTTLLGHSGGGVLATLLAQAHQGDLNGLILGAPAFRLADSLAPLSHLRLVRWALPTLRFPSVHPDAQHWTLEYASSRVAELLLAGAQGLRAAQSLRLPLLMLQARGDNVVSARSNESLFRRIPSPAKTLRLYDGSEHNVFHHYNPRQAQVFAWVDEFLGTIA